MKVRSDVMLAFGSVKGPVRSENQDDYLVYEPESEQLFVEQGRLIAIADGMGGVPGGAEASRVALRSMLASWVANDEQRADARLRCAYRDACRGVAAEVERDPALRGMGTTLTACTLLGDQLHGVHVGDSRCLLIQDGQSRWLTTLHLSGESDHRLTRAVGASGDGEEPDEFQAKIQPGDRVLLMTDGLWRAISEAECLATLEACPPSEAVEHLLERAQRLSGEDNATVVLLVRTQPPPAAPVPVEVTAVAAEQGTDSRFEVSGPGRLAIWWPWLLAIVGLLLGVAAVALDADW